MDEVVRKHQTAHMELIRCRPENPKISLSFSRWTSAAEE